MPTPTSPAIGPWSRLTREGWVRVDRGASTLLALAPRLPSSAVAAVLRTAAAPQEALRALEADGETALIAVEETGISLLTDVNRSFPLFWRRGEDGWEVSDDVRVLADMSADSGTVEPDLDSAAQFAGAGFVLGEATLYTGVRRTPPDATVHLGTARHDGPLPDPVTLRHREVALPTDGPVREGPDAGTAFRDALFEAVGAMVAREPGATYLLPLSGGADSRLLASAFVIAGARDVRCFTYGVAPTAEVDVSRRVADLLGLPWTFLATPPAQVRSAWQHRTTARFLADTYTGAALPHIQDWYALRLLRADPEIPQGSVIVPGHTAVRTLKDADLLDAPSVGAEELVDAIIRRHFSQTGSPGPLLHDPTVRSHIRDTMERVGYDGTPLGRARVLQAVNIDGRQSTYILNSVRGYESEGFRWAMPMLDAPLHRVTGSLDWELTRDRDWYRAMTDEVFAGVAGERARELSFWVPTAIPADRRRRMKEALRRVGMLRLAEHTASSRTNLRHPMAFEAFAPDRTEYACRIVLGESPLGVFARAFLEGRWNRWMDWQVPSTWSTPEVRAVPGPTAG